MRPRGANTGIRVGGGFGDEVAGQGHHIRLQPVDDVHRFPEGYYREQVIVVKIAELHDAEAIPGLRQTRQGNFDRDQLRPVGPEDRAIPRDGERAHRSPGRPHLQKFPPCRQP